MMVRFVSFVFVLSVVGAYTPSTPRKCNVSKATPKTATAVATIALSLFFSTAEPALANSNTAAQINLGRLPPSTISIQIQDLPVIGNLISGTYTKVDSIKGQPSVVIKSPSDKIAAVKSIITTGHLEFDVNGLINTHLDVDVGTDEAGVAKVRVASSLIPSLPFKNLATQPFVYSGKATSWNVVTNMGTGQSYYYNEETGISQSEKPEL